MCMCTLKNARFEFVYCTSICNRFDIPSLFIFKIKSKHLFALGAERGTKGYLYHVDVVFRFYLK